MSAPTPSAREANEWAPGWYKLVFAYCVATSIAHFVSFEVGNLIDPLSRLRFVAAVWPRAGIAVLRMEMVIYVSMKAFGAMKPRACANEYASGKPFRPVVTIGGAVVRWNVIIAVGAFRGNSDADAHLSLCFGSTQCEADSGNRGECKDFKHFH